MTREQYQVRWKDYYEVLQVHPRAEAEVIAAAYRRLAMMYHPDRNKEPGAEAKFRHINEAHEVLSDPERRARYDLDYQQKQAGPSTNGKSSSYEGTNWTYDQARSDPGQSSDGFADFGWQDAQEEPWYEEPEPFPDQEPIRDYYTYEPRPESVFSLAFVRWLLSRFADRVSPDPDERQRILPWPAWKWQRLWLFASFPLYTLLAIVGGVQGAWAVFGITLILLAGAVYSGKATSWMRVTQSSPVQARVAGGTAITLSGVSYALMIAYASFILVLLVISAFISIAFLRVMLDHYLGGGRK